MSLIKFDSNKARNFLCCYDTTIESLTVKSKKLKNLSKYKNILRSLDSIKTHSQCLNILGSTDIVNFYGSRIIGVATDESDLNIFLDLGGTLNSWTDEKTDYERFETEMIRSSDWKIINTALKTHNPIIEAVYLPAGLSCKYHELEQS